MTPPTPLRFTLLAALGVLQGCPNGAVDPGPELDPVIDPAPDPVLEQAQGLAAEKDWQRCLAVWREAGEAAFGGDPYPFTEKGKAELVERLEDSRSLVEALEQRGLLSAAEAGLLERDIVTLRSGVFAKRAKEMEMASCYEPMPYQPRREALESLAPRVELLEGLAAQEVLQPEVVARVLEQVREDLAKLRTEDGMGLQPDEQTQAQDVERRIEAALATIDHRLSSPHDGPEPDEPPPANEPIIPEASAGE
jgi:hypothetical protein